MPLSVDNSPPIHFSNLTLGELWNVLPRDIKGVVVDEADLKTQQALRVTSHDMRNLIDSHGMHFWIRSLNALPILAEVERFSAIRALTFVGIDIEKAQLSNLPASIQRIDLRGCSLSKEAIIELASRAWQSLKVCVTDTTPENDFLQCLASSSAETLTHLSLDGSRFTGTWAAKLSKLKALENLSLENCQFSAAAVDALTKLPYLRELVIGNNSLKNQGGLKLLAMSSLTSLSIRNIELCTGDGGESFWEAFFNNTSITKLDIGDNELHKQALAIEYLEVNKTIKTLLIAGNKLGNEHVARLANMSGLVELDVSGNGVGSAGMLALASNPRITKLNLGDNDVTSEGIDALIRGGTIKELGLFRCQLGDRDLAALWQGTSLESIDIGGNFSKKQILTALSTPASAGMRRVSIVGGPELSPQDVEKYLSEGKTPSGIKVDFHIGFDSKHHKIANARQLQEMSYAKNFDRIEYLNLSGMGFDRRSLALLPSEIQYLTIEHAGTWGEKELAPLLSRLHLSELSLRNITLSASGLAFLISLEHLKSIEFNAVSLDANMVKALQASRDDLNFIIDPDEDAEGEVALSRFEYEDIKKSQQQRGW